MSPRRKPEPVDVADDVPLVDDALDASDDLDQLIESIAGESEFVILWRADGPSGKNENVDKVPISRFSVQYVREKHGGGDYVMRAMGRVVDGRRPWTKYKEFSIDKSLPPKSGAAAVEWREKHPDPARPALIYSSGAPAKEPSWWEKLPAEVKGAVVTSGLALLGGLVTRLTDRSADPLLVELIKARGEEGGGAGVNPIELQRLLADERQRGLELGRELGEARAGVAPEVDSTTAMITKGIETLGTFAEGYRAKAQAEAAKEAAGGAGVPVRSGVGGDRPELPVPDDARAVDGAAPGAGAAPDARQPAVVGMRPWVAAVKPYAPMVAGMWAKMHPDTAAQVIGDALDDAAFDDLVADLADASGGGALHRIADAFPEWAAVPVEWLEAVVAALRGTEEDERIVVTAPPPPTVGGAPPGE